jgi:hypothetical protein
MVEINPDTVIGYWGKNTSDPYTVKSWTPSNAKVYACSYSAEKRNMWTPLLCSKEEVQITDEGGNGIVYKGVIAGMHCYTVNGKSPDYITDLPVVYHDYGNYNWNEVFSVAIGILDSFTQIPVRWRGLEDTFQIIVN